MTAFDAVSIAPRTLPKWLPPVGGLVAAAIVASIVCRLPFSRSLSFSELIGLAVQSVLEIFLTTAVTVWILCAVSSQTVALEARHLILRTSLNALWFAPLVLFIRENSPWLAATTAVLVPGVVKSARLLRPPGSTEGQDAPLLDPRSNAFSLLDSSPGFWRQVCGAGAALSAQTGALAALAGYPFKAALLVGVSSAVWSWPLTGEDNRTSSASLQSKSRTLLIVSLAIIFTAGALVRFLRPMYGVSRFGFPNFAPYASSRGDRRGEQGRRRLPEDSVAAAAEGDRGVILLPDTQTHTRLVAPPPVVEDALVPSRGSAKPLEIPFEGVYWFFRAPDVHPPRTSREAHGSPEMLDIRSTDQRPLLMEARENLGSMIDLACCSRIQVAIRNADHYPSTVSLELVLINSTTPGKPSQSLGTAMVTSKHPWKWNDKSPPANETLNFALPAKPSLRRFDEVRIVFRIDATRAETGPRIAIDRLVLIPRGL